MEVDISKFLKITHYLHKRVVEGRESLSTLLTFKKFFYFYYFISEHLRKIRQVNVHLYLIFSQNLKH